jgi:hypothetical protein
MCKVKKVELRTELLNFSEHFARSGYFVFGAGGIGIPNALETTRTTCGTVSKWGAAVGFGWAVQGLRAGYRVGADQWSKHLDRHA